MDGWFPKLANYSSSIVGSTGAFLFALATIAIWLAFGPLYHFDDAWQLIINSWTNIATFLVVFLIQNAQNRDSKAINLKLAELIRSSNASDDMIDVERLSDEQLERLMERDLRIREERERRRA